MSRFSPQLLALSSLLLAAGCVIAAASAEIKLSVDSSDGNKRQVAPAKDLEVYKQSIWVANTDVQRATINALTAYPEGFDILLQFISTKTEGYNAAYAAQTLLRCPNAKVNEAKIVALRTSVRETAPAEIAERSNRHLVLLALTEVLFTLNPKSYAEDMITAIRSRMVASGRTISFSDEFAQQISVISPLVDKRKLYPLVLPLADLVDDGFFSDSYRKAYSTLQLITGEKFEFNASKREERHKAAEFYRELYYTKLKPTLGK